MVDNISNCFRSYNKNLVLQAINGYTYLDVDEWLKNPKNIMLTNLAGDVGLFEHQTSLDCTVCGHCFFFSKGKEALNNASSMISKIFSPEYNIRHIVGFVEEDNLRMKHIATRLGFNRVGNKFEQDNYSFDTYLLANPRMENTHE